MAVPLSWAKFSKAFPVWTAHTPFSKLMLASEGWLEIGSYYGNITNYLLSAEPDSRLWMCSSQAFRLTFKLSCFKGLRAVITGHSKGPASLGGALATALGSA